jgi:putative SOS response-associated peptidase YedK
MPVILAPGDHARWLDPAASDPRGLLAPCPAAWLESFPVNPRVNNPKHDGADCIQPAVVQNTLAL